MDRPVYVRLDLWALFRVHFAGRFRQDLLPEDLVGDAEWEGTQRCPKGLDRHYFLIERCSPEKAIADLRVALERHGAFERFVATPVTPPAGWQGLGRHDLPIDWDTTSAWCRLTPLQQRLVENLLDDAEPTWIVLNDPAVEVSRERVEVAFSDLDDRGLVSNARQASGNPATEGLDLENWWAITDHGWQTFGLIKPPWYNAGQGPTAH